MGTIKTHKKKNKNHDCLRGNLRFWTFPNHSILGGLADFQSNADLRVDGHYGNWPWLWEQFLLKDEDPQEESFYCGAKSRAPGFQFIPFHSDLIHRWLVWSLVFKYLQALQKMVQGKDFDSHEDSTTMGIWFIWSHSLSNNIVQYSLFTWVNLPLQRQTLLFPEAYNFGDNFGSGWNMFLDNGCSYHGISPFFLLVRLLAVESIQSHSAIYPSLKPFPPRFRQLQRKRSASAAAAPLLAGGCAEQPGLTTTSPFLIAQISAIQSREMVA